MASKKKRKSGQSKANAVVERFVRPTPQREAHNDFRSEFGAVRAVPTIDTLYGAKKLTERQFNGLARYADVANAAERSEIKSNIDFTIYGSGEGLPHFGVRINLERDRLNKALGALADIAYAVCVRNLSISQWAMDRSGSVMRERLAEGGKVIRWYEPPRMAHRIAMIEIAEAGDRLAKAIGA